MNTSDFHSIKYKFKIRRGLKTIGYKTHINVLNKPIRVEYKLYEAYGPDYDNVDYEYFKDLMCDWMNNR